MELVLVEALGQITVDTLASMVVPTLAELFGEDEPQKKPALLPTISLPSSLLVLLLEVSDLGIKAGLASPVMTTTSIAPHPSLSLASVTVLPAVMPLPPVQLLIPEARLSDRPLLVSILPATEQSGLPVTIAEATGLLSAALLSPPLMLATMTVV